jgi:hypothetical protein
MLQKKVPIMNYTTRNIEKTGFYLLYELIALLLLAYFIPIWICVLLFIAGTFIILSNYKTVHLSEDSCTSTSILMKTRIIEKQDVYIRRKGTSSIYTIHQFEVIIYESKKEIGRIKFANQKEFERFSQYLKEYNYNTGNF